MGKLKRNIAILTIGDKVDFDTYQKVNFEKKDFEKEGFAYTTTDYKKVLAGKLPEIEEDKIITFFFFPFRYWNEHIEHKRYKGIYGNRTFYRKFAKFWAQVENRIRRCYKNKQIFFINDPAVCATYRDKVNVMNKLGKTSISQPKQYKGIGVKKIKSHLENGEKLFLKPRYGSMGKGITFLSKENWQTNFSFKNNKIHSKKSDYGWTFTDITGNFNFLEQLLTKDIIIEKGLDQFIHKGNMVDLRIYTFLGQVIYIYPRKNDPDKVTTNISQGGRGDDKVLRYLPKHLIDKAKRDAEKVSRALNIKLAGIDVVLDRNSKDVYIVDVNVFSGFPKRKTFNLARRLAKEIGNLSINGKLQFKEEEKLKSFTSKK